MAVIAFLLHVPDRDTTRIPIKAKLAQLDALGTTFLLPGVVCLLLALQWGGLTYPVGLLSSPRSDLFLTSYSGTMAVS